MAVSAHADQTGKHPGDMLDPIFTLNAGGIIQSASDSVHSVFGWTPGELHGRNIKILIPEPRRSALDRYLDRYRHADHTATLQKTRRFEAIRKDGKLIQIELSVSRADLPGYGEPYFIGIARDVTHQIDVGNDLVVERTHLQKLVTEQTRALATANLRLQLSDRLTSLGALAAGLGHDMNNVLLPVRARLNALEHAGMSPQAIEHLKAVRQSISYLQSLSDGLHFLTLDPDRTGAGFIVEGSTDLFRWWGDVGMLLSKAVPKHVRVVCTIPEGLPPVRIAPQWLMQAALNLIVNAGESFPTSRRRATVRIWAAVDDTGSFVRFGVTDNGRGMTSAVRHRAMDLFFTTKRRAMGTGLGLPLVNKVATHAGGTVEMQSTPGKGTTAVLILPIAPRAKRAAGTETGAGHVASIAITDRRASSLITQILLALGVHLSAGRDAALKKSNFWVTDPTPKALLQAARWRKAGSTGQIVIFGVPTKKDAPRWQALGASIIAKTDDFEAIRLTLADAISSEPFTPAPKAKS